ncbi:MAG: hypothetical protein F4Z41_02315 [Acidimicrobiia bacterium]|nr:hypothetical protein [bacterium]MXX02035.1 hypothetical protein [Acidimicrobiia bacterium]MDE0675135.1 hypothetical protein [bacterium]MXX45020.1 hypothetical protein [Acidimicrobiia bacterium]MXY74661.1 hypothetical protein [Acidimicrobiia bacterium]
METLIVHNSSRRSWIAVLWGGGLVVAALDLLWWNVLAAGLAERVFGGEEILEDRERVWAAMILAAGIVLLGWGLVSAMRLRPVLTVGPDGLSIALLGPFRPLVSLPWDSISEVFSQPVDDNGSLLPSLTIVLQPNGPRPELPSQPWGARWTGRRILRVLVSDWSVRAVVVETVANHYLDRMAKETPVACADIPC